MIAPTLLLAFIATKHEGQRDRQSAGPTGPHPRSVRSNRTHRERRCRGGGARRRWRDTGSFGGRR